MGSVHPVLFTSSLDVAKRDVSVGSVVHVSVTICVCAGICTVLVVVEVTFVTVTNNVRTPFLAFWPVSYHCSRRCLQRNQEHFQWRLLLRLLRNCWNPSCGVKGFLVFGFLVSFVSFVSFTSFALDGGMSRDQPGYEGGWFVGSAWGEGRPHRQNLASEVY